jgi:hypothetical protein
MPFISDNIESEGYITGATVSATTFYGNGVNLSNVATSTVTGGTLSTGGTATFTNTTGGTFTVTGFTTSSTIPRIKSNSVSAGTFSGNPKKASVTFTTAFPSSGYSVTIIGGNNRTWTYESLTSSGFTINANANGALTQPVLWTAIQNGEY